MSTLHPEAKQVHDAAVRDKQISAYIGQAAHRGRLCLSSPHWTPLQLSPIAACTMPKTFFYMLDYMQQSNYEVDPVLSKALDTLFILHADHEQNCSTSVMRSIGSADADPYSAMAGAVAALYGPLHGGANEAVIRNVARNRRGQECARLCRSGEEARGIAHWALVIASTRTMIRAPVS